MSRWLITLLFIFLPSALGGIEVNDIYAGADAIYNYKIWECEIKGDQAEVQTRFSVTILNARGTDYNGVVEYENDFRKIKRLKVRLLDANGNIIAEDDKKDLNKACGFGDSYELYSDVCTYYKEYALQKYPYTVEYELIYDVKSLFFWQGAKFQHYIPVRKASYRLICPSDFTFKYKCYGLNIEPSVAPEGDKIIYTWERDDITALQRIDSAPDGYPAGGSISFMADSLTLGDAALVGADWKNVGKWHSRLWESCIIKEIDTMVWRLPVTDDKVSTAQAIYDEVRDKTRYVSVSIGIGGWKPENAVLTQDRGYGDCKGLSALLLSRLRLAGIETYPVLALTRGDGLTDVDFPNVVFNHVFVVSVIDNDTIWMDPTCDFCRFGDLPYGDEKINVLVSTDSGGVIVVTPSSQSEDNKVIKESHIFINSGGEMEIDVKADYYGNFSLAKRNKMEKLDNDETRAYLADLLPGGERKYSLRNYNIMNLSSIEQPLTINMQLSGNKKVDELNHVVYINPNLLETLGSSETLNLDGRDIPVDWGYPYTLQDNIIIAWDSSLVFDSIYIPPDDAVECALAKASCHIINATDSIIVSLSSSFFDYVLPVEQFDNFEKYRDTKKAILSRYIRLYKKSE
ncbi:MAG: DUF3857 domain-containing protein [Candidatus Zixiibacteriota bacterium]